VLFFSDYYIEEGGRSIANEYERGTFIMFNDERGKKRN